MATLQQMTNTLVESVWSAIATFHNVMPEDVSLEKGIEFLTEEMHISPEEAWMRIQMETDLPPWCEMGNHHKDDFGQFFMMTILPVLIGMSKHIVEEHDSDGCRQHHQHNPERD